MRFSKLSCGGLLALGVWFSLGAFGREIARAQSPDERLFFDDFGQGLDRWTQPAGPARWGAGAATASGGYPATASGALAAQAEDCDAECTLVSPRIDLTAAETATLSLLRFIAGPLEGGAFVRLELHSRGTWTMVADYTQAGSHTARWQVEHHDLGPHLGAKDFQIRIRAHSTTDAQHVQIDDVRVDAQLAAPDQVSQAILERHVRFLSQMPRDHVRGGQAEPWLPSAHLMSSREYCAQTLDALGYDLSQVQDFDEQTNPWDGRGPLTGRNIHGYIKGNAAPGQMVMVSAHVDSVPQEESSMPCPGANDNASGVAAVLEVARVLAHSPHHRTTIMTCWDGEELGSIGSWVYASQARAAGWVDIKVNFVLDMIGWYSEDEGSQRLPLGGAFQSFFPQQYQQVMARGARADFIGLVGNKAWFGDTTRYVQAFRRAADDLALNTVAILVNAWQVPLMMDVMRSDHSSFWLNQYNAVFVTDTGEYRDPDAYHCQAARDSVDRPLFSFPFARKVAQATAEATRQSADNDL